MGCSPWGPEESDMTSMKGLSSSSSISLYILLAAQHSEVTLMFRHRLFSREWGKFLLHAVIQESSLPEVPPSLILTSKVTPGIHIWQTVEGKERVVLT